MGGWAKSIANGFKGKASIMARNTLRKNSKNGKQNLLSLKWQPCFDI
jgi:hypothetical protein